MQKENLVPGIVGLVIGAAVTMGMGMVMVMGTQNIGTPPQKGMDHGSDSKMSLEGKSGDEFDKAFIEMMIPHHEGAIDMAKEAQKNAKHEEIKSMANDIISSQQKEIDQMKQWQENWGY